MEELNVGPYLLIREKVYFSTSARMLEICNVVDSLALIYDVNDGTLLKHGEKSNVSIDHECMVKVFATGGHSELAKSLELVEFAITPETIEELNACIGITGRVLGFKERLATIAENAEQLPTSFGKIH
jgi:hypothetical protein